MNTNCNTALPFDAINVGDVRRGMHIRAAYSGEQGVVYNVIPVGGTHVWVEFTDGTRVRAALAGTFRLVNHPEGYNYHRNHGCKKS